ncbi:Glucan 1,3-beta-glucosidase [Sesamum alatum]|uniref:Glucan 1,3-beta-glucosidase n=1 Tax=Sesamum alatum TaxID=300844 RepID=A0AAE1YEB8_9LAMI|nr:Glucan 1,3-beta-glucosidase [Sesamum alatum]
MKHQFAASLFLFSWNLLQCFGQELPLKAVNLGGWLVIEGWMTRSLFDAIPNKDLLDGTQVHLKSVRFNKYLCAENGGGSALVANRDTPRSWETFRLWRINETTFNFRVLNKDFIGLSTQGLGNKVSAHAAEPGTAESFRIVRNGDNPLRVRIQASNGLYLQAETENSVMADYSGSPDDWGDQDPSIFEMHIVKTLQGEYQLTNGYGPDLAPEILRNHWSTYIMEEDFRFMSQNGLNAVRIPVGWWIIYDPVPPKPFVGGSLQALDNAFEWASNYNMKVILDLHAVPGSQNGNHHSGTRDGFLEWGDSRILETVSVIDFLAARYADHPSLIAIELMNEPLAPGVTFDSLRKYYKAGYDAVRAYTSTAYVILSNRLGEANHTELLPFAAGLNYSVIDVHYYNRYSDYFRSLNGQQNIDYVYKKRPKQLQEVTCPGGPLSFVGEWTADLYVDNASMQDYWRFAKAQLDVYGKATFGWAYWSYKCEQKHWSFRWMIENGYMKL